VDQDHRQTSQKEAEVALDVETAKASQGEEDVHWLLIVVT
jgi:hypothetical protein